MLDQTELAVRRQTPLHNMSATQAQHYACASKQHGGVITDCRAALSLQGPCNAHEQTMAPLAGSKNMASVTMCNKSPNAHPVHTTRLRQQVDCRRGQAPPRQACNPNAATHTAEVLRAQRSPHEGPQPRTQPPYHMRRKLGSKWPPMEAQTLFTITLAPRETLASEPPPQRSSKPIGQAHSTKALATRHTTAASEVNETCVYESWRAEKCLSRRTATRPKTCRHQWNNSGSKAARL